MPRLPHRLVPVAILTALAVAGGLVTGLPGLSAHPAAPTIGVSGGHPATLSSVPLPRSAALPRSPSGVVSAPSSTGRSPRLPGAAALFPPNPRGFASVPDAGGSGSYTSTPAPMGVSDLGVGSGGNYTYNTSSFEGAMTLTSFSAFTPFNATNASYPAPDWSILQLNAVAVNVSLPPKSSTTSDGTFWAQNGLELNGTTARLEDNVWNFSKTSAYIPPQTLNGTSGSIVYGEYYAGVGPTFPITYPLTLELFDNISSVGGHTVITFGYSMEGHWGTYDTVTFQGGTSATSPSQFLVSGSTLNPANLLDDAEFVFGGTPSGTNVNVVALNGTAQLLRHTASGYRSVPSAFDFGPDSSETALGVAVAYNNNTVVRLTAGPSFLSGLWNTSGAVAAAIAPHANAGWVVARVAVDPSYGLLFATNLSLSEEPLADANYSYAPTDRAGALTADLPPPPTGAPYVFTAWANGYASGSVEVSNNNATFLTPAALALTSSPSTLDAPVYLFGNAQAEAFGEAHADQTGYAGGLSRLWINGSKDVLAAPFLRVNDLDYPTFVLLAAVQVNLTFVVNGFVQAPSTYNYTDQAGKVSELVNWTQGYFFFYGTGHFTVENTSVQGNGPLVYRLPPTEPVAAVEFYHNDGDAAANLTAAEDTTGVVAVDASGVRLTNLVVQTGARGVLATGSSDLTLTDVGASGVDQGGYPSIVGILATTATVTATAVSVADEAEGIYANQVSDLAIDGLTVSAYAIGLDVNDSSPGSVSGFTVGAGSAAGNWNNSSTLSFTTVDVDQGLGLNLTSDMHVTVSGGYAVGAGSTVVNDFNHSSTGTFRSLSAGSNATALQLMFCSTVNITAIYATNGSLGANLTNVTDAFGSALRAANLSVALLVHNTSGLTFSDLSATNLSTAAYVTNSSTVALSGVTASNTTLDPVYFGLNTTFVQEFPIAGVAINNSTGVRISDVRATNYPFAVATNNSSGVVVSGVTAWNDGPTYGGFAVRVNNSTSVNVSDVVDGNGNASVSFNTTNSSSITQVFAFDDQVGINVSGSEKVTVAGCTLEIAGGVGLNLSNGLKYTVEGNNFVGNNGSAVNGTYNASHLQAWANGTNGTSFVGNYWADHVGPTPYVVNATAPEVKDPSPASAFVGTFLAFQERGLPHGWAWTVAFGGTVYTTNVSVLYVPGWAVPDGRLSFVVTPITYYPPHPASGTLAWSGTNLVQTIVFGAVSSPHTGLPIWFYPAVAGAAVAAVVVGLLLLRRGRRPKPRRAAPPPPAAGKEWTPDDQR